MRSFAGAYPPARHRRRIAHFASTALLLMLLIAAPVAAAQPAGKVNRLGLLSPTSQWVGMDAFREGLRTLGYVEGRNLVIEHRSADGRFDRLPGLAAELVRLRVEVIVAVVTQASLAAKNATKTIPVVMVAVGDPVQAGLVPSLARPGGNVTGTSFPSVEVAGKSLEALKGVVPALRSVAVLRNPANAVFQALMVQETEAAALSLGVRLRMFGARDAEEIERTFEAVAAGRFDGLIVIADPVFTRHRMRIAALAVKHRLPSASASGGYADAGGLIAYAPSFLEPSARAAVYVDKILKGAKPADLPVEQATKYELVLNLKTAKALGLAIPPSIQADRIVE